MTYGIKNDTIILVTDENQNVLVGYTFIEELTDEQELLYEKTCAENCGYDCQIIEGQLIKTETEASRNYIIQEKIKRIDEIESSIRSLGETETTSTFLSTVNTTRLTNLRTEKTSIEAELDELTSGLDESIINQIIDAIF